MVITLAKEGLVYVLDVHGNAVFQFKNSAADPRGVCLIGGDASYSGLGCGADYFAVAQPKKPLIHLYSWLKSQVSMSFHVQEVTTSLVADTSGTFLFGGSKGGRIFCWQLSDGALIKVWQAHFRGVSCMQMSPCNNILVTSSEDGMTAAWNLVDLVDRDNKRSPTALDTWSSHTLAVKDMLVMGNLSTLRVATCSLDQTVVLYDVHCKTECFRKAMPRPVESLLVNGAENTLYCGTDDGSIYILDMALVAMATSAAHMELSILGGSASASVSACTFDSSSEGGNSGEVPRLNGGHTACVTSMAMCIDDITLISASEDGSIIYWDALTRQMVRKWSPPNSPTSCSISNVLVCFKPEQLDIGVQRPSLLPFAHLKKYKDKGSTEDGSKERDAVPLGLHSYGSWAENESVTVADLHASVMDTSQNDPNVLPMFMKL